MTTIIDRVGIQLEGAPGFRRLRQMYRLLLNRTMIREHKEMRELYAQFISEGDLVFDIGANIGEYTEAFIDVGGRVVAVDPNPECTDRLRMLSKLLGFELELCAAGEEPGTATLNTCQYSYFATMNNDYPELTKDHPDYTEVRWEQGIEVPVVTLDQLAERHGVPAFVKIDVEGFEDNVIAGMSFRPKALSFEFSTTALDITQRVLSALDGYEFNALAGRSFTLAHAGWLTHDELFAWLDTKKTPYGDVIARRVEGPRS